MKNFFSNINFDKNQIIIFFFIPVAVLISMNIVSYMNSKDLTENERKILLNIKYLDAIETLRDYVNESQINRDLYFITEDKSGLDAYYKSAASVDSQYNKVKSMASDNEIQKLYLDTISYIIKQRFDLLNRGIEIQNKHGNNYKLHKTLIDEGAFVQGRINRLILNLKSEEKTILKQSMEMESSQANFAILIMVLGTVFSLILFLGVFLMLLNKTGQSLNKENQHSLTPEELETIVRERTAELSIINNRLNKTITEHEKTEAALKQSEKDLYDLFEQAHDAIIIFTPDDQQVLDVNNRATAIYGIGKKDFIGLSLKAIFKNIPENIEHIEKTIRTGYYYNFQTVHYRKNGTEMLMEINASVINYRGQKAILSINRDITERILSLIPLPGS